jgi:peptidyl-dipeptidase Dcp
MTAVGCSSVTVGDKLDMTTSTPSAAEATNPLLAPSPLYLQAPPFDRITDAHYLPAFQEGMRQAKAEIRAIADNPDAPTFENTIVAMERSGTMLSRVNRVFGNAAATNKNAVIEQIESDMAPQLAQHADSITLDAKLFARIHSLYERRETLGLDPVAKRLLENCHLNFVRGGALLGEADKAILRGLNEEESKLTTQFSQFVLKETNARAVVVDNRAELAGFSEEDIAAAATAASARGLTGKWVIPLKNTTAQPALATLANRALRERIYRASIGRGCEGGDYDTRKIIARLAQLRAQKAKLLGFATNGDYVLADQMAKTPQAALKLLGQVGPAAVAQARREIADMQAVIDREKGGFTLQPWDWAYYSEKVQKEKYDLDESEVRPYFELDHVLKDGMFFAATKLYGVTFKQRTDLPVYHPEARVFEVFNADGSTVGLIYFDCFARESKKGGAWMDSLVDQSALFGTKPVVLNELNIPKPAAGRPALLSFDEVITAFHEFGHGLHGLFSQVTYPSMSGTSTPRDFVEFPSQFHENFVLEPSVQANYAKHYQTGAPMPADLVAKVRKASTFNQGFATLEYVQAALIDLEWNALDASEPLQDPVAFQQAALRKHGVELAQVPPRYHSWYFSHTWSSGYQAGYYAYLWTAVLGADSFAWFNERGGMTAANGQLYRDGILSRGGTRDSRELYREFRGKDASIVPLLKQRGFPIPEQY